jgi:hypothetical protein
MLTETRIFILTIKYLLINMCVKLKCVQTCYQIFILVSVYSFLTRFSLQIYVVC